MGSDAHGVVHGPVELADLAVDLIEDLESRWSRFRDDSEVCELNRRAGEWVPVSPATITLVRRAIEGWALTGGRFDPTVLGDVVRAGYDRSFPDVAALATDRTLPASPLGRGTAAIEIDDEAGAVRLPAGVGFDPGGLGKGLAADLVAERISDEGAAGVLVNLGGDLRAIGVGPGGDDWTVEIDPAATGEPLALVAVEEGAIATSTTLRRHWSTSTGEMHHLIDPSTGRPADNGVVAATVLSGRGWRAEVLAKAALLVGIDDGLALLADAGADGVLVDLFGGIHRTPGFERFGHLTAPALAAPTLAPRSEDPS